MGLLFDTTARALRAVARDLAAAVAPLRCFLCGAAAADGVACAAHAWSADGEPLGLAGARCGACLAALGAGVPDGAPCAYCRRRGSPLAGGVALGAWRRPVADGDGEREGDRDRDGPGDGARDSRGLGPWVFALKHGRRRELARPLGIALGAALAERLALDPPVAAPLLVPIPLHPLRRLERGFDQALELARHAARAARVPLAEALVRSRATAPQGTAFGGPRARNVRRAFAPRPPAPWSRTSAAERCRDAEVWLVDDVASSAATATEAAHVLLTLGATRVRLLLVARGGPAPPTPPP